MSINLWQRLQQKSKFDWSRKRSIESFVWFKSHLTVTFITRHHYDWYKTLYPCRFCTRNSICGSETISNYSSSFYKYFPIHWTSHFIYAWSASLKGVDNVKMNVAVSERTILNDVIIKIIIFPSEIDSTIELYIYSGRRNRKKNERKRVNVWKYTTESANHNPLLESSTPQFF